MTDNTPRQGAASGLPRPMKTHDRVMTAISIIQSHILALDSQTDGPAMWSVFHMPSPALEQAVRLLAEVLPRVENIE